MATKFDHKTREFAHGCTVEASVTTQRRDAHDESQPGWSGVELHLADSTGLAVVVTMNNGVKVPLVELQGVALEFRGDAEWCIW